MVLKTSDRKNSIKKLASLLGGVAGVTVAGAFISCPAWSQTESIPLNLIVPELNNYIDNNYIDNALQQSGLRRFTIPSSTQPLPGSSPIPTNTQSRPANPTFPSNAQPRPETPTFSSNTQPLPETPTFSGNTQALPERATLPSNTQPLPGSSTFPNKITIIERIHNDTGINPGTVPFPSNSFIRSEIIPLPSSDGTPSSTGTEYPNGF